MPTCTQCGRDYPPGEKFCPEDGAPLPTDTAPADPKIGLFIGNYQITQKLGEGGMGAVYKAVHPRIGREVAVKILHPECAARPDVVERFFDEAMAANRINHPNIIEISDSGSLPDGTSYLMMELLSGQDLKALLKEKGTLPLEQFQRIFSQVLEALKAAHEKGIVHRDLKPENIFLCQREGRDDFVKLVDFGIAKLSDMSGGMGKTRTGMLMGTPAYMSPEQAMGKKNLDHRSDIYSLGVIFYECLSGAPPFRADSFGEILIKHATEPPIPLREFAPQKHIPPALDALVQRCLAKDPEQRPASIQEVLEVIQNPATYQSEPGQSAAPLPVTMMAGPPPGLQGSAPSFPPSQAAPTASHTVPPTMFMGGAPPPGAVPPPTGPGATPPPVIGVPLSPGAAPRPPGDSTFLVDKSPLAPKKQSTGMKPLHLFLSALVLLVGGIAMIMVLIPDKREESNQGSVFSLPGGSTNSSATGGGSGYPEVCQTLKKRVCACTDFTAYEGNPCQEMQLMESAYNLSILAGEDPKETAEGLKEACEEILGEVDYILRENGC